MDNNDLLRQLISERDERNKYREMQEQKHKKFMKTLGINIDGVIRSLYEQFDKVYRKTYIHNPNLIAMNEDFTVRDYSEEEVDDFEDKSRLRELEMINLPLTSPNLTNHYKFENVKDMIGDKFLTPKEACDQFMYEKYTFQIFADAEEYENACEIINKIQIFGLKNNLFNVVLLSTVKSPAIPSTYYFLSKNHSRARNIMFLEEDYLKWGFCDVLIDCVPEALQSVPEDKKIIKINQPFNQWDKAEYSFDSLSKMYGDKEFFDGEFVKMFE